MESIELKSTQSRFCDSSIDKTEKTNQSTIINIDSQSMNQSILTEEENSTMNTFTNSRELEVFIANTSKLVPASQVLKRVNELLGKATDTINQEFSLKTEAYLFKRKEPLFTLKSVECFSRIIERKHYDVNLALVRYFELALLYENVSELTNDKETLVKLINLVFMLIKSVDCASVVDLLEYRLQILIKKTLLLNSSNSNSEALIKNALTPLLMKEDTGETKKSLLILEPILEFFNLVKLDQEFKYNIFYEYLCYFIFPLLPNLNYSIIKNETKQEQKPFGLYNPVLMIKNTEVATKTYTLLNFIDNNIFNLVPQFNLNFYNLDLLLNKLNTVFLDENSKSNVNLRFALFVIFKRIILIKEYSHLFSFNYSFSEIEHFKSNVVDKNKAKNSNNNSNNNSNTTITDETPKESETLNINSISSYIDKDEDTAKDNKDAAKDAKQSKDPKDQTSQSHKTPENFHSQFIKAKLSDIINTHDVIRKISIISLEMFRSKVDSESNEITNFFSFLIDHYEEEVNTTFKEFNFDLTDYLRSEKVNSLVKTTDIVISDKLKTNQLSSLTEGLLNSYYITAGNTKDIVIYAPRNSLLYFTSTITYYDALVNIYRYDANKEGVTDRFVLVSKEQKIESDFTPFEVTVFSYKNEIYKISVDNSFSWMNGKEIKYKLSVLQLSGMTRPSEAHRFDLRYKIDFFKEQVLNKITEFVFFKYETFLGKNLDDYKNRSLSFNYLANYSQVWLSKFVGVVKNKEPLSKLYSTQIGMKYLYKKSLKKKLCDVLKIKNDDEEKDAKDAKEAKDKEKLNTEESLENKETNIETTTSKDNKDNKDSNKNKEDYDEILIPSSLQDITDYPSPQKEIHTHFLKQAFSTTHASLSSLTKGKRTFKLDRLASIDIIIRSYIKNVFVRVNTAQEELEDPTFKSEICKFEDTNDQFIFFNYYYFRQNADRTLGDYFEKETINNSNIVFMKFPLAESCLVYYMYCCALESVKIPEKVVYLHFDASLDKYNYAVFSDGDVLGDEASFPEKEEFDQIYGKDGYKEVIRKTINAVNFRKSEIAKPKKSKKKSEESEESESSDDEEDNDDEEKEDKLKSWKIVVSFTGSSDFVDEAKHDIKGKIAELNKEYVSEGKTKKEKKIKVVFKSVQFVCDMTSFMHCFELYS